MFTSFLKGDSSLGGQGRTGLGGELGRQTHPFDFPAFFVRRLASSAVTISCSQDYSDEQQDEEQQRGQHIAQLLEEMCVVLWDNDIDDAVTYRSQSLPLSHQLVLLLAMGLVTAVLLAQIPP